MLGDYLPYYECRTYDKNGKLIKIELIPPRYDVLENQEGFFGKRFRSRDDYKHDGNGAGNPDGPEL